MVDIIRFLSMSVTEGRGLVNPASEIQSNTSSPIRIFLSASSEQAVLIYEIKCLILPNRTKSYTPLTFSTALCTF